MSWMDSWSRPNKQSATPPPLYLTRDDVKYCSTCGRVIGERRAHQKNKVVKYCSDGCREHRPGPLDRKIERTILALLQGQDGSGLDTTGASGRFRKGDRRNIITCDEIERLVFDRPPDTPKAQKQSSDDVEETDEDDNAADENEDEAEEDVAKRTNRLSTSSKEDATDKQRAGQKRAREREMVRRAARRAVVFGLPDNRAEQGDTKLKNEADTSSKANSSESPRRKCEALMNGQVVEPSFAKGDWAVRWRE